MPRDVEACVRTLQPGDTCLVWRNREWVKATVERWREDGNLVARHRDGHLAPYGVSQVRPWVTSP